MGRPPAPPPEGFEEAYLEHGWEAKDLLGIRTDRFKRLVAQLGGEEAKRRRRNYVMGRRLSSLKAKPKTV
jgi:hypothetical protein